MQRNLFSIGDWNLTSAALDKFLDLPAVARLRQRDAPAPTRTDQVDSDTATELLAAAKAFFTEIMRLWFAILDDLPIKLTEATMHAGQEFEKGWLVAHGHWFSLQGAPAANGDRTYAILPEVVMLNVNSMLRVISPIVFNAANKNARPRRARGGGFNTTTTYLLNHSDWERLTSLL
jgi:hypothetical protein